MIGKQTVLLLLTAHLTISNAWEFHCRTPTSEEGICVHQHRCQSLSTHHGHGAISARTGLFLKQSRCGSNRDSKICCPISSLTQNLTVGPDMECGQHYVQKIIGGEKAELDEFPWMALLEFKNDDGSRSFECGGVLINKRYVLTAAHCLTPNLIGVRLGEFNVETDPDCVETIGLDCAPPVINLNIEEKIIHEEYNPDDVRHYNDVGLIRLDHSVEYSDFVKPICLPMNPDENTKSYVGKKLTIAGWGRTEKGTKSTIKLKVEVPGRRNEDCTQVYQKFDSRISLIDGQICAGGVKGKDSCKSDSGGPLMHLKMVGREPRFFAAGVVSFGPKPCGRENIPGVYTRVSKYVGWIVDKLRP